MGVVAKAIYLLFKLVKTAGFSGLYGGNLSSEFGMAPRAPALDDVPAPTQHHLTATRFRTSTSAVFLVDLFAVDDPQLTRQTKKAQQASQQEKRTRNRQR